MVLGRLANVYGPGQTLGKPQGLLSQLCLADATRRPLPVFVSLDTIRDYLYAGDAARMVVRTIARARAEPEGSVVVKVLASGRPVTVGYLVSEARRVFHRPLRTIPVGGVSAGQVLDLRLESRVWTEVDALATTPLAAGLASTSADVRARVVARRRARPVTTAAWRLPCEQRLCSARAGRCDEHGRPERQVTPAQEHPVEAGDRDEAVVERLRQPGHLDDVGRSRGAATAQLPGEPLGGEHAGTPTRSRTSPGPR